MTPRDRIERRIDRFIFSLLIAVIVAGCVVACTCSPNEMYCPPVFGGNINEAR